jgi:hypothetical protein
MSSDSCLKTIVRVYGKPGRIPEWPVFFHDSQLPFSKLNGIARTLCFVLSF